MSHRQGADQPLGTSARAGSGGASGEDLQRSMSLLNAAFDSTADGLLVADGQGRIVTFNRRFAELWRVPTDALESGDEGRALEFALGQLKDPEGFLRRVRELYALPEQEGFDVIEFRDGRIFERYSRPQRLGDRVVGRVWSFRDVTEARRVELALRASEERFRATFDQAAVGLAMLGLDGRFLRVNARLCEILGLSRDDLLARNCADLSHPEDREADVELLRQVVEGVIPSFTVEKRHMRKDGRLVWLQRTMSVVRDAVGRPEYLIAAGEDITARKLQEAAINALVAGTAGVGQDFFVGAVRELANVLRVRYVIIARVLPASPGRVETVAMWVDGRLEENVTYRLSGTPCENVVGRELCYFPTGVKALFPTDHLLVEMGVDSYLGVPLFGPAGQSLGLISVLHDRPLESEQTAKALLRVFASRAAAELHRRETEAAVRESEERYRAIFSSAPDAVLLIAAEGPAAGTILSANEAAERMHGYGSGELAGLPISVLDAPEAAREVPERLRRIGAGEQLTFEIEHRRRDGSFFPVEVVARRIQIDGRFCVLAFDRDVSARKAAEHQLRQALKLEALGRLAGGVAHDFNNILGAILGNADLARRELGSGHPVSECLDEILHASRRAKNLVQQILAFTRHQQPQRRVMFLTPVIEEVVGLLRATLSPGSVLEANFAPGVPPVLADATQVHQALLNLVTNARQALPQSLGRIEISLTERWLGVAAVAGYPGLRPGRHVILAVSDNGHGMSPEVLQRLFDPFFTTKAPGEGTGLGLSVVHGVMKSHEGAVFVSSEPGRGTRFELVFPASDEQVAGSAGPVEGAEGTPAPGGPASDPSRPSSPSR